MNVTVVIPFAGDCPHRQTALDCVTAHYRSLDEHWAVLTGTSGEPWCKAIAVNTAVQQTSADILVIADADCLCEGITEAVTAVADGAPWAMPHHLVHRLTGAATQAWYDGQPRYELAERAYRGTFAGGIVVIPRATWQHIPLDPRFTGWGQEDESWALALAELAGPCARLNHDLVHLWHPPPQRQTRRIGSKQSQRLHDRYRAARHRPDVMRALIDEAKELLHGSDPPHDHARHHHSSIGRG